MNLLEKLIKRYTIPLQEEIAALKEKNSVLEERLRHCEVYLENYPSVCENIKNLNIMLEGYPKAVENISGLNNMLADYPNVLKNVANLNTMLENYPKVVENISGLNNMLADYPNVLKNVANLNTMLESYPKAVENISGLNNMLADYPNVLKNVANLNTMLENYPKILENIGNINSMLESYPKVVENISGLNNMLADYPNVLKNVANLNTMLEGYPKILENIGNINAMLKGYPDICANIRNLNITSSKLTEDHDSLRFGLSQLRKKISAPAISVSEVISSENSSENTGNDYSKIDYLDFENHFRGSTDTIKKRQREYLDYFKDKSNVLDIGCGRGEFLELMKEEGINAVGVDLYSDYADLCKEKGLTAYCCDGIKFLKDMDKVDGIMACQVIEHLTVNQIIDLVETAYEKLEENGIIIMETPNPRSLSIYTNAFYVDPTHIKPVHPETIRYFLNKAGFKSKNIQVVYTKCSKPDVDYPELEGEAEFNKSYRNVLDMLYGSQDYAVIAIKC